MNATSEKIVIGVDLGGTHTAAGLVNGRLEVLAAEKQKTVKSDQEALLKSIVSLVRGLLDHSHAPVAAIGFGIPSMIDQAHGRAVMSVNIPLADVDFVTYMQNRLELPVFIDNDANVAALAELRAGAAQGAKQALMITVGTGIGGGIIIDGEIYRGATGSAAELGHIVIDVNGPPCQGACPNNGCFETMASGTALNRYAKELAAGQPGSALGRTLKDGQAVDGALVSRLAHEGDPLSLQAMAKIGFYIGVGVTSLVNVFNPEVFVLGGGIMEAGGLILDPALAYLRGKGLKPNRDIVKVVRARFRAEAGMIGAACLALDAEI